MAFVLSEAHERELAEIMARYPNKMAACIPVLHLCQNANDNWVSPEVIQFVS
jgi:NADH-quinone oxidoreductase subunit E